MNHPVASIIIPTYNRLILLTELIESLNRQTFQDFEVIIINDGGEKIDIVQELYPHLLINILETAENKGHVHARNDGLMRAKGEFIMLIDDDDLIVPTHIETMLCEIKEYDFVYSDVEIVNYQIENNVRIMKSRTLFAYELDLEAMRRFSSFVPSGCLYRRELHKSLGLFDTEMHHYWDWDFFLRVADKYRVKRAAAAGVLYDFSDENNNLSKSTSSKRIFLDKLAEKHGLGYLPTKNFQELLNEPEVRKRKAASKILWDGRPFASRLALRQIK